MFLGIGTLYSQTGVYVGQWSGGLQNGPGKSFFKNGNKYEGDYMDGFKHGKGTFTVQVRKSNNIIAGNGRERFMIELNLLKNVFLGTPFLTNCIF